MPDDSSIRFFGDSMPGRRGEILDAAIGVFHRRGYDGGTMREIADAVGVSEPALYRHFAGKEDLFEQLIKGAGETILSEVVPLLESASPGHVGEVLASLVADRRKAVSTYLPVVQTIMIASVHNERFLGVFNTAFTEPLSAHLASVVRRMDEHNGIEVPDERLPERVRTLISLFAGHVVTSFVLGDSGVPFEDVVVRVMGWERP